MKGACIIQSDAEVYKYQFCHVCCVCFLQRSTITGAGNRIHGSDQECEGCLSVLLISEVVSMAVVKIRDSVLVKLAHQTVSVALAKKSRIPSFICVSVLFLSSSDGGLMWQTGRCLVVLALCSSPARELRVPNSGVYPIGIEGIVAPLLRGDPGG